MELKQIENVLAKINGATFASLDTTTQVKLKGGKKNEMQGRVTKVTTGNRVMLFSNKNSNGYENMIKRRLEAEGKDPASFKLGALPWGTRIPNSPLIEHKGEIYIQVIFQQGGESTYFLDDQQIEVEQIEGFTPPVISAANQNLKEEHVVIVRTIKLCNIDAVRMMGESIAA